MLLSPVEHSFQLGFFVYGVSTKKFEALYNGEIIIPEKKV